MKTQIPIYRAKKIDNGEYVIGYYLLDDDYLEGNIWRHKIFTKEDSLLTDAPIYQSTLAIHFPNMLDSEETKIFASLSEDGKGGDIINIFGKGLCYTTFDIDGAYATIIDNDNNIMDDLFPLSYCIAEEDVGKVTGIKQ